jgi:hypothetical protein
LGFDKPPHSNDVLRSAIARAKRAGRPLLVFVLPTDDGLKGDRGTTFGSFLNHAPPAALGPLAMVEVACATTEEIRAVVPSAGAGEPLMYLVDTDGSGQVTPIDATLAKMPGWDDPNGIDKAIDDRIVAVGTLLKKSLLTNPAMLERWEKQATSIVGARELAAIEADVAAGRAVSAERLDRGAVYLVRHAADATGPSASIDARLALLGGAAAARLTKRAIDGSRWARSTGCGASVEGDPEPLLIGCGMGHVPAKSQRFLFFFANR